MSGKILCLGLHSAAPLRWAMLLCLPLALAIPARAQLMMEIAPGLQKAIGPNMDRFKLGSGVELILRYRFIKPFTIGFGTGYYNYPGTSKVNSLRYYPLVLNSEYYFLTSKIRPYAGLELGAYYSVFQYKFNNAAAQATDLGVGAYSGVFFLPWPGLALDVRVLYRNWLTQHELFGTQRAGALGVAAGLVIPF